MSATVQTTISESVVLNQPRERDFRFQLRINCQQDHRRRYWIARDRSEYVCPMCNRPERREFDVHHIDGDWLNGRLVNLVALCDQCHKRVHRVRDIVDRVGSWKQNFRELGEDGGEELDPCL